MAWTRVAVALVVALSFVPTPGRDRTSAGALHADLELVSVSGVRTLLPPKWEFRPLREDHGLRQGVQASTDLAMWSPTDLRRPGMEAFWVDATGVGVPTDYFGVAASGPALDLLDAAPGCRSEFRRVAGSRTDGVHPGHFIATVIGSCHAGTDDTRWASFVAAPGYGAVRELGIPRSGLYVVRASVPQGPHADRRLRLLMKGVAFGGTSVGEFLAAAGLPPRLP